MNVSQSSINNDTSALPETLHRLRVSAVCPRIVMHKLFGSQVHVIMSQRRSFSCCWSVFPCRLASRCRLASSYAKHYHYCHRQQLTRPRTKWAHRHFISFHLSYISSISFISIIDPIVLHARLLGRLKQTQHQGKKLKPCIRPISYLPILL